MRTLCLLFFCFICLRVWSQTLTVSGTVSSSRQVLSDALIDVYEYNAPIQTLHSDVRGSFSFPLVKGKEYLVLIYKPGYLLQSFSISDNKLDKLANYDLTVSLEPDPSSPDGLYFKQPAKRIAADIISRELSETKFSLDRIKPKQRSDSVSVLLNRAQANQYILIAKMKMATGTVGTDSVYSRQILTAVKSEIAAYATRINESNERMDMLLKEEDAHVAATFRTKDDAQLQEITEAQRLLADRLAERVNNYLLQQQMHLAQAREFEIEALQYLRQVGLTTDSAQREDLKHDYWLLKSKAANARYLSMDANRKFQLHSRYQVLQYQEYIELLRYKETKNDTQRVAHPSVAKPKPLATNTAIDTSDNLSGISDAKRTKLIQQALEEEERFSNYEERTSVKKIDGADLTVKDIRISNDNYEMLVDRKGAARYFKNGKPITKITFDFETKRRMVDVLNTIKQVEKLK